MTTEEIKKWLQSEIDLIEKDWDQFPPQYCGAVEAAIQTREKDAKIELLYRLISNLE